MSSSDTAMTTSKSHFNQWNVRMYLITGDSSLFHSEVSLFGIVVRITRRSGDRVSDERIETLKAARRSGPSNDLKVDNVIIRCHVSVLLLAGWEDCHKA